MDNSNNMLLLHKSVFADPFPLARLGSTQGTIQCRLGDTPRRHRFFCLCPLDGHSAALCGKHCLSGPSGRSGTQEEEPVAAGRCCCLLGTFGTAEIPRPHFTQFMGASWGHCFHEPSAGGLGASRLLGLRGSLLRHARPVRSRTGTLESLIPDTLPRRLDRRGPVLFRRTGKLGHDAGLLENDSLAAEAMLSSQAEQSHVIPTP